MNRLKKLIPIHMRILFPVCLIAFLIVLVLSGIMKNSIEQLDTQQMSKRWSKDGKVSQISCFFSVNTSINTEYIEEFEHNLENALKQADISVESPNANARLWVDAYSASGKITVKSNIANITTDCLGIGGDFFQFHPIPLISGSYFSGNDLVQDLCVLDKNAAWKLFGSNDVVGQVVYIGDVAHIVTGVVEHEDSDLYQSAGLDEALIYVSYASLEKYGLSNGMNHYEILMPNPVKGYAKSYVKDNIGIPENEMELVENSTRFDFLSSIKKIKQLPFRSMNGKAIIYPYWENVARATEDKITVMMFFELLFLSVFVIILTLEISLYWKNKKWTLKSIFVFLRKRKARGRKIL